MPTKTTLTDFSDLLLTQRDDPAAYRAKVMRWRRENPAKLRAFVRALVADLNAEPHRTGTFTVREIRALVLGTWTPRKAA